MCEYEPATIQLRADSSALSATIANVRHWLMKRSQDPSLQYTVYPPKRVLNNLVGAKCELAMAKYLGEQNVHYISSAFLLTFGLFPPLFDFFLASGETLDVKGDRWDIRRLGGILENYKIENERLNDYTVWAEARENSDSVILHGYNTRGQIREIHETRPDATTPSGERMPKPCKRLTIEDWHPLGELTRRLEPHRAENMRATMVVQALMPNGEVREL